MTELEKLRVVPRSEELARRFARRVEPTFGFIAYGILYVVSVVSAAALGGIFAAIGLADVLGFGTTMTSVLAWTLMGAALVGSTWPFVRWARGKRRRARTLIEQGELVDATPADRVADRAAQIAARLAFATQGQSLGVMWYRVEWMHGATRYHAMCPFAHRPAPDERCTVLFHPASEYGLAFEGTGRGIVTRVRSER